MYAPKLLTRDAFRDGVFMRDSHRCVFCSVPAVDAHHILERRLFDDGGYYLDNGASVCELHHLECEMTLKTVDEVREACGIRRSLVPEHLYPDQVYDKWGNPVLANGQRTRGELFFDESVQKVLRRGGVLDLFTNRVKFPRTHHLPWSEGLHDDDRLIESLDAFFGKRVIVSTKWDGENSTLYSDFLHARSVDGRSHPSRAWLKGFWATIAHDIPPDWRVCGENLFAEHSISYTMLPSFFLGFSVWNERNVCLSWDDTHEWFALLGVTPVDVLFDGIFDEKAIRALYNSKSDWATREGYVVRIADSFAYGQYRSHVAKFVRKGHVQTNKHWMHGQRVTRNQLAA
jgi:hypothetical protein